MSPKQMGFWKTEYFSPPSAAEQKYKTGPTMAEYEANEQARKDEVLARVADMTALEIAALLDYMAHATVHVRYRGWADCRVCGEQLGTTDQITPDGKWVFPEKWEHYILAHGVRPDEDFIQDALGWLPADQP